MLAGLLAMILNSLAQREKVRTILDRLSDVVDLERELEGGMESGIA